MLLTLFLLFAQFFASDEKIINGDSSTISRTPYLTGLFYKGAFKCAGKGSEK